MKGTWKCTSRGRDGRSLTRADNGRRSDRTSAPGRPASCPCGWMDCSPRPAAQQRTSGESMSRTPGELWPLQPTGRTEISSRGPPASPYRRTSTRKACRRPCIPQISSSTQDCGLGMRRTMQPTRAGCPPWVRGHIPPIFSAHVGRVLPRCRALLLAGLSSRCCAGALSEGPHNTTCSFVLSMVSCSVSFG